MKKALKISTILLLYILFVNNNMYLSFSVNERKNFKDWIEDPNEVALSLISLLITISILVLMFFGFYESLVFSSSWVLILIVMNFYSNKMKCKN